MKIASANLQMASNHASLQHHEVSESLRMWVGPRRPDFTETARRPPSDTVTLSDAGKTAQTNASSDNDEEKGSGDPRLELLRNMLEFLTGKRIRLFDADAFLAGREQAKAPPQETAPQSAGYGVEYDYHESYTEMEQTEFSASGSVTTADGRSVSFSLQLSMQRSYHEESSVSLRLGDAARPVDPLVLNFSGTAAELTDQRFAFDLDSDGDREQINFVAPGSGFLVFDRNNDGIVNNGKELFGPSSGDGFKELASLDQDDNGWIDENDAAFEQLSVWRKDADGADRLDSLAEAGVGAIALTRIATPFDLTTNANELLGQIRSSGVFLQEDGGAGTIQQIDLTA